MKEKLDCFIVGEFNHSDYNRIKDLGMNTLSTGHYASETVGVKALMPLIEKTFKVSVIFINNSIISHFFNLFPFISKFCSFLFRFLSCIFLLISL